jgi:AraC family transcriptional regulator of arabinose operon
MSLERDAANLVYRVLAGRPVSAGHLARAGTWFAQLDTPLDARSFSSYIQTLQRGLPADSPLAALLPRWRGKWRGEDGFGAGNAGAFLQDYIAHLDPNLLFRAPITAGYALWDSARLDRGFAYASLSEQAWSLLYIDRGGARLRSGGRDLALAPGQVLLVAPGALYALQPQAGHPEWGYYWAVFHADSRWREWLRWSRYASQVNQLALPAPARDALAAAFAELVRCLQGEDALRPELSHNLLEQIILRCRACLPDRQQPLRDARIQRARDFIEAHYREGFSLAAVANAASLSASRLAGLFRQHCGTSVLAYRDELRMLEAARLLRERRLDVAAVGNAVGYPDPAYFSRTFSRHVGVSPSAYQRQA